MEWNALVAIVLAALLIFIFTKNKREMVPIRKPRIDPKGPTLFTCTTYLAKPGKYEQLIEALTSFFRYYDSDKIREFLVINEYDAKDTSDKIHTLEKQFPFVRFITKTRDQRGQTKSLNLILDYLRDNDYTYWIGWEESWYSLKPFVAEAHDIMESTSLGQLQFTNSWRGIPKEQIVEKPTYTEILPSRTYPPKWVGGDEKFWPLFSLRPGIDRVTNLLKTGYFDETPEKWPITFEYDYSLKWINHSNKGILKSYAVDRSHNHVSTYAT